jgi:hypothetical protein
MQMWDLKARYLNMTLSSTLRWVKRSQACLFHCKAHRQTLLRPIIIYRLSTSRCSTQVYPTQQGSIIATSENSCYLKMAIYPLFQITLVKMNHSHPCLRRSNLFRLKSLRNVSSWLSIISVCKLNSVKFKTSSSTIITNWTIWVINSRKIRYILQKCVRRLSSTTKIFKKSMVATLKICLIQQERVLKIQRSTLRRLTSMTKNDEIYLYLN